MKTPKENFQQKKGYIPLYLYNLNVHHVQRIISSWFSVLFFGRVPVQTTSKPRPTTSKPINHVQPWFENASNFGRVWTRNYLKRVQIKNLKNRYLKAFGRGGRAKTQKLGDTPFFCYQKISSRFWPLLACYPGGFFIIPAPRFISFLVSI